MSEPQSELKFLTVYVPRDNAPSRIRIEPGAGVVGSIMDNGYIRVDCQSDEGFPPAAVAGSGIETWEQRVHRAARRHLNPDDRSRRLAIPPAELVEVGFYVTAEGRVVVPTDEARALIDRWTGAANGTGD